jgi:uncharacterized protein YdcH (DUF465 family)
MAVGTSVLSITQNAPFIGPAATAITMLVQAYQKSVDNCEAFQDLMKVVNNCDIWKNEILSQGYKFQGTVAESPQQDLVEALVNVNLWMKHVDRLLSAKNKLSSTVKNMLLGENDSKLMDQHISKLEKALQQLKDATMYELQKVIIESQRKIEKEQQEIYQLVQLTTLKNELGPAVLDYMDFVESRIEELDGKFLKNSRTWMLARIKTWLDTAEEELRPAGAVDETKTEGKQDYKKEANDIDPSFHDNNNSKLFWIRSDAGMGKSCVAAKCCKKFDSQLLGKVFFSYTEEKRSKPVVIIKCLALQIAKRYPDVIGMMSKGLNCKKIDELFEHLLVNPLQQINLTASASGDQQQLSSLLLVIDALDECKYGPERTSLLNFLGNSLLSKLPSNVKILITSRAEPDILEELNCFSPSEISENDPNHQEDLKLYINSILTEFNNSFPSSLKKMSLSPEKLVDLSHLFFQSSKGSFLYIAVTQEILKKLRKIPDEQIIMNKFLDLPRVQGVDAVFLELMKEEDVFELNKHFLQLMTASQELLSVSQLSELLDQDEVLRAYDTPNLRLLFPRKIIGEEEYFTPYHKSVLDILKDPKRSKVYYIDEKEAHSFMVERLLRILNPTSLLSVEDFVSQPKFTLPFVKTKEILVESKCSLYLLDYLDDHFDIMGEEYASFLLLTDFTWMELRRSFGKNCENSSSVSDVLKRVKEDYAKRIRSTSWLQHTEKEKDYFQEFKYIFEFLSFVEPTKFVEACTGAFQKLLFSLKSLKEHSRIRLLVYHAVIFLQEQGNSELIAINSNSYDQVGFGLVGKCGFNSRSCSTVLFTVLHNEGVILYSHGYFVYVIDIISCLINETASLKLDEAIEKAFYLDGLLIIGLQTRIEFWIFRVKNFKWSCKHILKDIKVLSIYKFETESRIMLWTNKPCCNENVLYLVKWDCASSEVTIDTCCSSELSSSFLAQRISMEFSQDCFLTLNELNVLKSEEERYMGKGGIGNRLQPFKLGNRLFFKDEYSDSDCQHGKGYGHIYINLFVSRNGNEAEEIKSESWCETKFSFDAEQSVLMKPSIEVIETYVNQQQLWISTDISITDSVIHKDNKFLSINVYEKNKRLIVCSSSSVLFYDLLTCSSLSFKNDTIVGLYIIPLLLPSNGDPELLVVDLKNENCQTIRRLASIDHLYEFPVKSVQEWNITKFPLKIMKSFSVKNCFLRGCDNRYLSLFSRNLCLLFDLTDEGTTLFSGPYLSKDSSTIFRDDFFFLGVGLSSTDFLLFVFSLGKVLTVSDTFSYDGVQNIEDCFYSGSNNRYLSLSFPSRILKIDLTNEGSLIYFGPRKYLVLRDDDTIWCFPNVNKSGLVIYNFRLERKYELNNVFKGRCIWFGFIDDYVLLGQTCSTFIMMTLTSNYEISKRDFINILEIQGVDEECSFVGIFPSPDGKNEFYVKLIERNKSVYRIGVINILETCSDDDMIPQLRFKYLYQYNRYNDISISVYNEEIQDFTVTNQEDLITECERIRSFKWIE